MDLLNTAIAALAVGISLAAFWRTLFLDQVVVDLVFVWDVTLGDVVGKLVIENPLRHSIYISGICFKEPTRDEVVVRVAGEGLHDVISSSYDEAVSSDNTVAAINTRIPPQDTVEFDLEFQKDGSGLRIMFRWSTATPWAVKFLIPRSLKYSAKEINAMKRAAKRGEVEEER